MRQEGAYIYRVYSINISHVASDSYLWIEYSNNNLAKALRFLRAWRSCIATSGIYGMLNLVQHRYLEQRLEASPSLCNRRQNDFLKVSSKIK
jgi:hypothetical protein